ncbi:arm repeat superfamily protein [Anaeramoeba ignava]|uniref:Arm repeat superfamily protein n=1 Tax=Anaeramoeba ignava TaxID=1746090 RepID=A0A9Q0LG53_ANAIG|nr:arm repeat superfamily protein [Anaeramoeba ignava]
MFPNQNLIIESTQKQKKIFLPLGKAIRIAITATVKEFEEGKLNPTTPVGYALEAIYSSYQSYNEKKEIAQAMLIPIMEFLMKQKTRKEKEKCFMITKWLFRIDSQKFLESMEAILADISNKTVLLGCVLTIIDIVESETAKNEMRKKSMVSKKEAENPSFIIEVELDEKSRKNAKRLDQKETRDFPFLNIFSKFLKKAQDIVVLYSVVDKETGKKQPIILTMKAAELMLSILLHFASVSLAWDGDDDYAFENLESSIFVMSSLAEWYSVHYPLFYIGIENVVEILYQIQKIQEIIKSQKNEHLEKFMEESDSLMKIKKFFNYSMYIYIPFIRESNPLMGDSRAILRELESLVYLIGSTQNPESYNQSENEPSEEETEEILHRAFISLSLLLGKLKQSKIKKIFFSSQKNILSVLLNCCITQIRSPPSKKKKNKILEKIQKEKMNKNQESILGTNAIASHILRLTLRISGREQMDSIVTHLMSLITEKDSATFVAIILIAEFATENPANILGEIFDKLESSNKIERENALLIIEEIFIINNKFQTKAQKSSKKEGEQLIELSRDGVSQKIRANPKILLNELSFHLLRRLHDEELTLRAKTSHLFSFLDPDFIVSKLILEMNHKDGRVRSAADSALLDILMYNQNTLTVLNVIIDKLSELTSLSEQNQKNPKLSTPLNPGKISTKWQTKQALDPELVFRIIKKWCDYTSQSSFFAQKMIWVPILDGLIDSFFQTPENHIKVKLFSIISLYVKNYVCLLLPKINLKMEVQKKLDLKLLEFETEKEKEKDTEIKNILFERLAPLLVLKALSPFDYWKGDINENENENENEIKNINENENENINENINEIQIKNENQNINEIENEIINEIENENQNQNQNIIENIIENQNIIQQKNSVSILQNLLLERMIEDVEYHQIRRLSSEIYALLPIPFSNKFTNLIQNLEKFFQESQYYKTKVIIFSICNYFTFIKNENIFKLKEDRKTINNIVEFLLKFFKEYPNRANKKTENEELEKLRQGSIDCLSLVISAHVEFSEQDLIRKLLTKFPNEIGKEEEFLQVSIIGGFISSIQKLSPKSLFVLCEWIIPEVLKQSDSQPKLLIRSGFLELLFSISYQLKNSLYNFISIGDLYDVSMKACSVSNFSRIRFVGLKLIGFLLTFAKELLEIRPKFIFEVTYILQSISNIDSDPNNQQIAQKLFEVLNGDF